MSELQLSSGGGVSAAGGGFSSMESATAAPVDPPSNPPPVEGGVPLPSEAEAAVVPEEESSEVAEEKVVPAELFKTATEAQAHGEPYFLYREETTGEVNAMPVKKQPLQYVPKHLDWYCRICHYWVDDEQEVCFFPPFSFLATSMTDECALYRV